MINKKFWFSEGVNADDTLRAIQEGWYLNAENIRTGVSALSKNFETTNVQSTNLLYNIGLPYTNLGIGRAVDFERKRLIWCDFNSNGLSQILAYDLDAQTTYIVLKESQTQSGFNWNRSYRIARNAKVVNGLFIYTDNLNEPQCIDIEAGIKLNQPSYVTTVDPYGTPVLYTTSTLIKRPPIYVLTIAKKTDSGFINNYTANNAYQFVYFYTWKNSQNSALSSFSQLAPPNYATETFNSIDVYMPFSEGIDDYVQSVTFCVRYGNFGKTFKIRTWDKANYYDNLAILSHNAGAVQLGFRFYDNVAGIALDDVSASNNFDNVALLAKTVEIARNRVFLGSLKKGYTTPTRSSLSCSLGTVDTGGGGSFSGTWKYMTLYYYTTDPAVLTPANLTYLYVATAPVNTAYYFSAYRNTTFGLPGSINASTATTAWATEVQLAAMIILNNIDPPVSGGHWSNARPATFTSIGESGTLVISSPSSGLQFFKSSSTYDVTITFFDRFKRPCGVVKNYIQVTIPDRTYNQTVFNAAINWALSNANPTTEIPDWAYYYQIYITLNLTTRFFAQIYSGNCAYILKKQDGSYDTSPTTFAVNSTYATGIDITTLFNAGLGYNFTEGDLCRVYKTDGTNVVLPVLGVTGNFVMLKPTDLGTFSSSIFLVELYTPYRQQLTEPFYATGSIYPIINPTLSTRTYSVTSGTINGDAYAINRTNNLTASYYGEYMSPNDKVWQIWQTDRGWINEIDNIGQTTVTTKGDFSDTYISGTRTNGLNKFQPLNDFDIGSDSGGIQKLQLTNKLGEQIGTVMLCIATNDCLSIYLGESQLLDAGQNSNIALSTGVVGSINALRSDRGTINPESVVTYNGVVWWVDMINGVVAQYSDNGIIDVSAYKMSSFWDRYCKKYSSLTAAQITALCGFGYIESAVDPSTKELLITLPQVEINVVTSGVPIGFAPALPSYTTLPPYATSIQNRFSIYDGQPKTMVFKYEQNKWAGAYLWLPDCFENIGDRLFAIKNGSLYVHNENTTSYGVIYNVQYPARICLVCVLDPSAIADLFNIVVEGSNVPDYTVAYATLPWEQITDLTADDFTVIEGLGDAKFYRDRLTPTSELLTPEQLLYKGNVVKSPVLLVMVEFRQYNSQLLINFINIGTELSQGNSQILNQK